MKTLLLLLIAFRLSGVCLPVTGDRILGRDLALADPRFSSLPSSLVVATTPPPGMRRTLSAPELGRVARANGIQISDPVEVCFEFAMQTLSPGEALFAMKLSLPAGVEPDLIDFTRSEVPAGRLLFPISGLSPATSTDHGERLWRGFVQYTETRRQEIWAKVTLSRAIPAVVAKREIPVGAPIGRDDVEVRTWSGPYTQEVTATELEEVIGRAPRRAVHMGSPIPLAVLQPRLVVRRGDAVKVVVVCGKARLLLDAIAVREAREGELVELRNPASGKLFVARMESARAVVQVSPGQTL